MSLETLFYSCQFFVSHNDADVNFWTQLFHRAMVTDQSSIVTSTSLLKYRSLRTTFGRGNGRPFLNATGRCGNEKSAEFNLNELNRRRSWEFTFGRGDVYGHCVRTTKTRRDLKMQNCITVVERISTTQSEGNESPFFSSLSLTAFQTG